MPAAVMRPRYREQHYPIGRLVLHQAQALGLSRTEIVQRLGYTELSGGHRALSHLMLTGIVPPFFTRLADALELDPSIVEASLRATARQHAAEASVYRLAREKSYCDAFRPHLQVQVERDVPSPIFVAALMGTKRLRIVELPDMSTAAEDERDEIVRAIIVRHYDENSGNVVCFGRITGYLLVSVAGFGGDFGVPCDVAGYPSGSMISVRRLPDAMLGRRRPDGRLNGLLRNNPIKGTPGTTEQGSSG